IRRGSYGRRSQAVLDLGARRIHLLADRDRGARCPELAPVQAVAAGVRSTKSPNGKIVDDRYERYVLPQYRMSDGTTVAHDPSVADNRATSPYEWGGITHANG